MHHVVVTGAGSGIGRSIALEYSRRHARLALCDLRSDRLETVAEEVAPQSSVFAAACDVSRWEDVENFAKGAIAAGGPPDVVVANAGIGLMGSFRSADLDTFRHAMDVNLWGAVHTIRAFSESLIEAGRGHFVVVASMAGFAPLPGATIYNTTKSAVLALGESLRAEYAQYGIGVSIMCPGFIDSRIVDDGIYSGEVDLMGKRSTRDFLRRVHRLAASKPERVARSVVRAVERNRGVVPVTGHAAALYRLRRWLPRTHARINSTLWKRFPS